MVSTAEMGMALLVVNPCVTHTKPSPNRRTLLIVWGEMPNPKPQTLIGVLLASFRAGPAHEGSPAGTGRLLTWEPPAWGDAPETKAPLVLGFRVLVQGKGLGLVDWIGFGVRVWGFGASGLRVQPLGGTWKRCVRSCSEPWTLDYM